MTTPALVVEDISVAFGDVRALREVGFALEPGTITGLIGPNGAGKTTLLDVVSGFLRPASGRVLLDGTCVTSLAAHRRAALRLGRTFQTVELFEDMSVAENLSVAAEAAGTGVDAVREAAQLVGIDNGDSRLASGLSHGDRRRLALARALVGRPAVLLLDEPAAGLDPDERRRLGEALRDVALRGAAVLLVDHDLGFVLETCDRVVVLDFGAVIADDTPAAIGANPAVAAAYVGTHTGPPAAAHAGAPRTPASAQRTLSVRGLSAGYGGADVVSDVDLDVAAGEIVTLLGPNGAGKTTTLLALSGALPRWRGSVDVLGRQLRPGGRRSVRHGVAHVLQNNRVFAGLTAGENLRLASRRRGSIDEALERVPALKPLLGKPAGLLSGGEQQMLAVARALVMQPRLLIVDELSLGLAPRIVADLLETLATLSRQSGMSILLAEQHAELALGIAERAYVLVAGRIVLTAPAAELAADPARLTAAYLGRG
jgi:branched-chain amino acid transport system ATP-binding protein